MKVLSVSRRPGGFATGPLAQVARPRVCRFRTRLVPWQLLLSLFTLVLLFGTAHAGPMAADDGCLTDNDCQAHYNQAVKLFEEGRFETALPEFQAAYQRRQMPWLLINIGRTLHRLGRSREALEHYERYKQAETRPDPETLERVEKYIAQARVLTATTKGGAPIDPMAGVATDPPKPIYKKWWFWTAIGGGVAAIVVIGVVAGVASSGSAAAAGLPNDVPKVMFSF